MGIFGWDYPPGVSSVPGDEPCYCEVCGKVEDDCVCPECTVCGAVGDPVCYSRHGMMMTERQQQSLREAEAELARMDKVYDDLDKGEQHGNEEL